jgi:hypothetical protein
MTTPGGPRNAVRNNSAVFNFPAIPYPIQEDSDWVHVQNLHPRVLRLSKVYGSLKPQSRWEEVMHELCVASEADSWTDPTQREDQEITCTQEPT